MVQVRRAVPEDPVTLAEIAQDAYGPYAARIGREPAPMRADYAAAVAQCIVLVAEDEVSRILGFVVLAVAMDHLHLGNLAVAPDSQCVGIGTLLLELAEEEARNLGFPEVRLFTNELMSENLRFYRRRGYVENYRAEDEGFRRSISPSECEMATGSGSLVIRSSA